MHSVLVAGDIHPAGVALLKATPGLSVDWVRTMDLDALGPGLPAAEAVLWRTQPLGPETLDKAPRLRLVSRYGVGLDAIDLPALAARGIALATVGDVNSRSVAEHTILMMLAAARRLVRHDAALRGGNWDLRDRLETDDLFGRRLLVIGFGRIGRLVAGLAQAIGLEVAVHDPFCPPEAVTAAGYRAEPHLDAALGRAEVLTVHVPATGAGPLIGAAELARLPAGALVINTARGGLIDETALARAIAAGHLGGAGFDVFTEEPPGPDSALLGDDRIVLSPHNAGLTEGCARRMSLQAARNIVDFFAGTPDPRMLVAL
ncbi:NAD(P)-dependent oxidoreductase [Salipiger sp.]|uniref:NAD(P)-dependent oxidoreductase n=1 Tax=Salipiger sp. TaxID=2078585 RepID=UPI003A96E329